MFWFSEVISFNVGVVSRPVYYQIYDHFALRYAAQYTVKVSNPLKWIALGSDYEYPIMQSIQLFMFILYILCKWDQASDIHLNGLSI